MISCLTVHLALNHQIVQLQTDQLRLSLQIKLVQPNHEVITQTDKDNIKEDQASENNTQGLQEHKVEIINSNVHIDLSIKDKGKDRDKTVLNHHSLRKSMVLIAIVTNRRERKLLRI